MRVSEATKLIQWLFAAYDKRDASTDTLRVYIETIKPFSSQLGARAIAELIGPSAGEFIPRPGQIARLCWRIKLQLADPLDAWLLVLAPIIVTETEKCIACIGLGTRVYDPAVGYEEACPDCNGRGERNVAEATYSLPPLVAETVTLVGGRSAIRQSEHPHLLQRDFIAIYERLCEREVRQHALAQLGLRPDEALARAEQEMVEDGWTNLAQIGTGS